jgi:hypothetical protein
MEDEVPDARRTLGPSELQALIDSGRPLLRCACGWLVVSNSEAGNRLAYDDHDCPEGDSGAGNQLAYEVSRFPARWYDLIFEFGLWEIVGAIAFIVVVALLGKKL